jgi:metallophosphoesterase superfamily enzyme
MGYKILDVKADIHEDVEKYFELQGTMLPAYPQESCDKLRLRTTERDILNIVDKHFERIER